MGKNLTLAIFGKFDRIRENFAEKYGEKFWGQKRAIFGVKIPGIPEYIKN
jgi:hypothetical protein